jgi:hypothetical protein
MVIEDTVSMLADWTSSEDIVRIVEEVKGKDWHVDWGRWLNMKFERTDKVVKVPVYRFVWEC